MKKYRLTLFYQLETLDLRKKREQIKQALSSLVFDKKRKDVSEAILISIEKSSLELEVVESGKFWHQSFGKKLKNEYGMSNFCDPKNQNRLFNWPRNNRSLL